MQQSKVLETWVGLFVVLGLVAMFFLAMKVSNLADLQVKDSSYKLIARFQNVGSLKVRSPVSMAGVRIGRVSSIQFDTKKYEAVVEMHIEPQYNTIPTDTTANILTAGLLGEQYISLSAGGEEAFFKDGDEIELSQSALVLEEVISRFLFSKAEGGSEKKESAAASQVESAPEEAKAKPKAKEPDKAKPKVVSTPKAEKGESETVHKPKEAHGGLKAKGGSPKDAERRTADPKPKAAIR